MVEQNQTATPKESNRLLLTLSDKQDAELKKLASKADISVQELIRRILDKTLGISDF